MKNWIQRFLNSGVGNDTAGNKAKEVIYTIDQIVVIARRGVSEIGRLKFCELEQGVFVIGDVEVCEDDRKNGIGSCLITTFLDHCQSKGAKEVFGNVTANDDTQPFLRKWYEKMGFVVAPPDGREEYGEAKYKIIYPTAPRNDLRERR